MSNLRARADEAAKKLEDMIKFDEMSETVRERLARIRTMLLRKPTNVVKLTDRRRSQQ